MGPGLPFEARASPVFGIMWLWAVPRNTASSCSPAGIPEMFNVSVLAGRLFVWIQQPGGAVSCDIYQVAGVIRVDVQARVYPRAVCRSYSTCWAEFMIKLPQFDHKMREEIALDLHIKSTSPLESPCLTKENFHPEAKKVQNLRHQACTNNFRSIYAIPPPHPLL